MAELASILCIVPANFARRLTSSLRHFPAPVNTLPSTRCVPRFVEQGEIQSTTHASHRRLTGNWVVDQYLVITVFNQG